jgi:Family of unknown function (DUF6090)
MIKENKVSKYLLYAIGEIILVVIGILIALSINNWNEKRKDNSKELKYLTSISQEIKQDSIILERSFFKNMDRKIQSLELAKKYIIDNYIIIDTIQFISNVGFGGINSRASFLGSSRTYNELISTGNLSLISNDRIRKKIVDYYDSKKFTEEYVNNIRTEYASYFNSLKVFNPKFRDSINPIEIPRILKLMRTEKFLGLINQEMTYAFSIFRRLEFNKKEAHKLYLKIEENLQKQK